MADDKLPTIGEAISQWLGVQLPSISMPQTLKNVDKAVAKIILACGENVEARIRSNTSQAKAEGKIRVEETLRTPEERRKLENRTAATKAALEDLEQNPGAGDAKAEIEDDWLNFYARLAEDKSSEELQGLFGRILAGEIKRPGSFSLRTLQLLVTISKNDAEGVSKFLSYAIDGMIVPYGGSGPTDGERLFMQEMGIAGHPSQIGGMSLNVTVYPEMKQLLRGSAAGILIENKTKRAVGVAVPGQPLTKIARELIPIAHLPETNIEFLKKIARDMYGILRGSFGDDLDAGLVAVHVVKTIRVDENNFRYQIVETASNT
jgi:hypothetical protein